MVELVHNAVLVLRALLKGMEVEIGEYTYFLHPLDYQLQTKMQGEDGPVYAGLGCELSAFITLCEKELTEAQRVKVFCALAHETLDEKKAPKKSS